MFKERKYQFRKFPSLGTFSDFLTSVLKCRIDEYTFETLTARQKKDYLEYFSNVKRHMEMEYDRFYKRSRCYCGSDAKDYGPELKEKMGEIKEHQRIIKLTYRGKVTLSKFKQWWVRLYRKYRPYHSEFTDK